MSGVECPECQAGIDEWAAQHPEARAISRSYVQHLHWTHRPHHPSQVGPAKVRRARRRWSEWEAAAP